MIDRTLNFLLGELNAFLGTAFPASEAHAVLSSLALPDGSTPQGIDNKLVLSMMNLERDTIAHTPGAASRAEPGEAFRMNPSLHLNVFLLLAASFPGNYAESLRFLSSSLGFLQSKPVFTPQNSSSFPRGLERLTLELVNMNMQDLQNLWACVGAKYLPSALYKARLVTIQDAWVIERVPVITGTATKV
jgi:hypothetical protein